MTYAVKLLPNATSPETLRNAYFKQLVLIEPQLISTAYLVLLFMVWAGKRGERVLVCYPSWPRTCSLQTDSSKAWVTYMHVYFNRKKPSTRIQDTASNEPIHIKDIFISSYLKCKSQRKEKQLFPVNKVQHNRAILHIVKVHVDGRMLFSHTVHGNPCQRRSKESGPNSFIYRMSILSP